MIKAPNNVCPRCGGDVPNTKRKGEYIGALSRVDNQHEICSACGMEEALMDFAGETLQPVEDWPLSNATARRVQNGYA